MHVIKYRRVICIELSSLSVPKSSHIDIMIKIFLGINIHQIRASGWTILSVGREKKIKDKVIIIIIIERKYDGNYVCKFCYLLKF